MSGFLSFKKKPPLDIVRRIISSKYFPFFTAAVYIACYYACLDIVVIYYTAIVGVAMVLLLDDLTPLVSTFLFMNVMISLGNSPSQSVNSSDYFYQPAIYVQIFVLIAIYVVAIFYRLFFLKRSAFRPTPVFWGLCALSAAFLLNGAGSSSYSGLSSLYGLFMAFFFLVIFTMFSGNVKLTEENYIKIAYGFVALSLLLIVELTVKYITVSDSFKSYVRGAISYNEFKLNMVFGWGIWNTMGMLLCISIPAVFMLASKSEYGYLWIIYATVLLIGAFMSMSRQSMLGACLAYVVSAIAAIIKSRSRFLNTATIIAFFFIALVTIAAKWSMVTGTVSDMMSNIFSDGQLSGNGRVRLLLWAVKYFTANPVFGSGFFMALNDVDFTNLTLVPELACNTFAEMLGACGFFGIFAYCVHRVQTVVAFAQKPTWNKFYVAAIIGVMLFLSLVDNHIFYILPTLVYSGLLSFATGEEREARLFVKTAKSKV